MEFTHTLTFSLRDWQQGCNLLERIGFNDEGLLTDSFELDLFTWQEDGLIDELSLSDIEFTLRNEETGILINN